MISCRRNIVYNGLSYLKPTQLHIHGIHNRLPLFKQHRVFQRSFSSERKNEDEQEQRSIFSFLKESKTPDSDPNGDDEDNKKSHRDWVQEYEAIQKDNNFELNIDPSQTDQLVHFKAVSSRKYNWMNVMIASNHPLRYEEFMVGAFHGMDFILRCLQENDKQAIESCISRDLLEQFEDMKWLLLDEQYRFIGKIMLYLQEFDNGPNYEDMSINARYSVTYYYQLMPIEDDNDIYDQYIQKRADVVWKSLWLPSTGLKFEISDEGWIMDSVEVIDIPKAT